MRKAFLVHLLFCLLSLAVTSLNVFAQESPFTPVSARIFTAKTVFISNLGQDEFPDAQKSAGVPLDAYGRVYQAVASWGRYKITTTPSSADLILEVRSYFVVRNTAHFPLQHGDSTMLSLTGRHT